MAPLPSPGSSPSLTSSDATTPTSRKRQRSQSMQSDTSSSSVKRSVSEGISLDSMRSPSSDGMSNLTLADSNQDIDAYMAGQGEAEIPPTLLLTPPHEATAQQTMSASEKWMSVVQGQQGVMQAGETWYVVSRAWWKRWARSCGALVDKENPVAENELGPVDNSSILDPAGRLLPGLLDGIDIEFVPEGTWRQLLTWYGPATHTLPRRVVERGLFAKTTLIEVYPPQIRVMRLSKDPSTVDLPHPTVEVSMADTIKDLCSKVADAVRTGDIGDTPYRVWKPDTPSEDWRNVELSASALSEADAKVIDESSQTLENQNIESGDLFVVEFKQPDGWLLDLTPPKKPLAIEPPPPLFNSKDNFFNRMGSSTATTATTKTNVGFSTSMDSKPQVTNTFSVKNNYSLTKALEPGTLGLGNMGNTCFMNSALQCLAHTKELSEYFLNGIFKAELNRDNPLGMHGAIAEVFGALLERIWASSGPSTSYSPREFKQTLQKFAPQFSGYQQHDSQELVAFLLDGLHEDLNRVLKKPYVEKPDWEGGGDVDLVKLAAKSWEGYMLRNDSVIVDLFQGQYQSTLVCPECSKISITFDPFMYLTLPLPVQKKWKSVIYYIPWDLDQPHVKVPIEINRDSSFKDLRNQLGRWMNSVPENLLMFEIFQHKFYKLLDDNVPVSDIGDNDTVVCFELPCNARLSRSYKKKDDDPFIIPLFLCDAKNAARSYGYGYKSSPSLFGYPAVAVINQEQASSVDGIYDAIVTRLQRWTRNARDLYDWEVSSSRPDSTEPVAIPIQGFPPVDTVTEIIPVGDAVTVQPPTEEVDLTDEKDMMVDDEQTQVDEVPRAYRTKQGIFTLKLCANLKDYGGGFNHYSRGEDWVSWEEREAEGNRTLLKDWDALYVEFDENMKAYYFGEPRAFEHALWEQWGEFIHPDLAANTKKDSAREKRGISLQDCLDEFVKEEQLGEDDLWYCPRCKKHQQATKKFDLWKAPDILVVHLKRFSNNRLLRDKIDALVDFPVEGLDIGNMIGERIVAERLKKEGVDLEELKEVNLEEPHAYDLFAVDEHMGGLGGGHYRAYAANHMNGKWYHFDDGYVSQASAEKSVNSNAYLLFYRRRSNKTLGGESYQQAMQKQPPAEEETELSSEAQLPTPPNEPGQYGPMIGPSDRLSPSSSTLPFADYWTTSTTTLPSGDSPTNDDPPDFEDQISEAFDNHPYGEYAFDSNLRMGRQSTSPTSSIEVEADGAEDRFQWDDAANSPSAWSPVKESQLPSPTHSDISDPFEDQNTRPLRIEIHEETQILNDDDIDKI